MEQSTRVARRIAVSVIGATLLVLGVVLLVTPGPGLLILASGLGVLALEFAWARRWLTKLRKGAAEAGRAAGLGARGASSAQARDGEEDAEEALPRDQPGRGGDQETR